MALVLPHAPAPKSIANLKVPAAAPPKPGPTGHPLPVAPGKFQALLDHATQTKKPTPETHLPEKAKAPKAKADTPVAEKPREVKKVEPKDHRGEGTEALALVPAVSAKVEAPKVKVPEGEALSSEKAKAPKADRRMGTEVPAPVTAASGEVARAQAQQNAPKADRTEDRQKVFVVDRRSDKEKDKLKTPGAETAAQVPVNASVEVQAQNKAPDAKANQDIQVSFQSLPGKGHVGFEPQATPVQPTPRDAATFQQYLVERGYGQLVDQARIVLKDQNAGEIRMTLYPESLGKVKVSLDLSDNTLAGQIYVENQTVKDVFQSNMDGLLEAFQGGGWNDVSLQVSVGGEGGAGTQNQPQTGSQARDYGRQVAQTGPTGGASDRIGSWNDRQINLTA